MNEQEMNVAIAEACGWNVKCQRIGGCLLELGHDSCCCQTGDCDGQKSDCPNYLSDLNAMNDCPHNLSLLQYADYGECLNRIVARDNSANSTGYGVFDATARQRAEAFLKTKGLWKE